MYTHGRYWNQIFGICNEGLSENPDNELLKNVRSILLDYDKKYGIKYKITTGTLKGCNIK